MTRRFQYIRDPIFLTTAALYLVNRLILKPIEGPHGGFFHDFGNDLLCIPFCLPPCLWAYRVLGVRGHDRLPTRFELCSHLVVWSVFFEWIAPRLGGIYRWTVGDWHDVVAYTIGATFAGWYWGAYGGIRATGRAPSSQGVSA